MNEQKKLARAHAKAERAANRLANLKAQQVLEASSIAGAAPQKSRTRPRRWETETVLRRVDSGDLDPHCLTCGGLLKTNTVLFGEMLPDREMTKASWFAAEADAVVAVGTTLSVYPAAEFALMAAVRAGRFVIVNLGPTEADDLADVVLAGSAGEMLPLLFAA